jgi:hypothetical protein
LFANSGAERHCSLDWLKVQEPDGASGEAGGSCICRVPEIGTGTMLHWILLRLAAYIAVVVAVGLLFLAGASMYALMWPKPVVPFGQMGH